MDLAKVIVPEWIRSEFYFSQNISFGVKGILVRRIQEWLCLHSYNVEIDGIFGKATERAVMSFQRDSKLPITGVADKQTFIFLIKPMTTVLLYKTNRNEPIREQVVRYADLIRAVGARELNGRNQGVWVRLFMRGYDGDEFYWCAGFTCFVIYQILTANKKVPKIPYTFSCDVLAEKAKDYGLFINATDYDIDMTIKKGDIFLKKRTGYDWTHCGIIKEVYPDDGVFETIEGNSNNSGNRNGEKVVSLIRKINLDKYDFVRLE